MSKRKKEIRKNFRQAVFERDKYMCKICGETEELDAHHITDRAEIVFGGYIPENGITLCFACHFKAEEWHSSGEMKTSKGFLPNDLYEIIGSSFEEATLISLSLGDEP